MKANISGIIIEGTPEEIIKLIAAAAAATAKIEKTAPAAAPAPVGETGAETTAAPEAKHRRFKQLVSFKLKALSYALKYRSIGEMCAANPSIPYKALAVGGLYTPAHYVYKQGEIVRDALAKQGLTVEWYSRVDHNGRAIIADFRNGDNGELPLVDAEEAAR